MAGLAGLRSVQKLVNRMNLAPLVRMQQVPNFQNLCRSVGTSNQKKSTTSDVTAEQCKTETKPKKYWVPLGFSEVSEELDRHMMHGTMFVVVTLLFTCGAYLLAYLPDFKMHDWTQREAYIVLREREKKGLPPIDKNFIDPAKIILPTDEELGDTEIVI